MNIKDISSRFLNEGGIVNLYNSSSDDNFV